LGILTLTGGGGGSFGGLAVVSKLDCDGVTPNLPSLTKLTSLTVRVVSDSITCVVATWPGEFGLQVRLFPTALLGAYFSVTAKCSLESVKGDGSAHGCAAECAVRFEPVCANTGFFDTSVERFRVG